MAEFAAYQVWLLDWTGEKVWQLFPGDDFVEIAWQHVLNAPGAWTCKIVAETDTMGEFFKHCQVLVERDYGDGLYEEFVGFYLAYDEQWLSGTVDEHYWTARGWSPEWLIDQPLLQPVMNVGNDEWAYYSLWWMHGAAADVVRAMVGESMVSPADDERAFSQVTVEGADGTGTEGCYEGRFVRLMDAVVDAVGEDGAKGGCDFRVVRVSGGYEFRAYAPFYGTDRRRGYHEHPTVLSTELENVRNIKYSCSWAEEVTVAIGLWQGGGAERTIYQRQDDDALAESPYSRREAAYDIRDVSQPDQVNAILDQKLRDDGLLEWVEAEIVQTDDCLYGDAWGFGDLLTLDLPDGRSFSVRVVTAAGALNDQDQERIEGRVELWTRAEVT